MWRIGFCSVLIAFSLGALSAQEAQPSDFSAEAVYRPGGDVTAPRLISKVEPSYSDQARKAKVSGAVLLNIIVDSKGIPRDLRVARALGYQLDEEAIKAVSKWRFNPGMRDGNPVAVRATIEVSFRLLDGQGKPSVVPARDSGPTPATAEEGYRRGMHLFRANNFTEAEAMLSKAVSMKPSWSFPLAARAQVECREQKMAECVSDYSKAIALNEPRENWFYDRGLAYSAMAQYTLAIADYSRAIDLTQEKRSNYLFQRGWSYWQLNDGDMALVDLSKALALDPALTKAYATRGAILAAKKDWQHALADLDALVELDPSAEAYAKRSEVRQNAGDRSGAAQDEHKAGIAESPASRPVAKSLSDSDPSNPDLKAPNLLFPANAVQLKNFPRRTVCSWEPVNGAAGYVFEWDYSADGVWWQESRNERHGYAVGGTSFFFDFVGKQPGRWRVSAVDAEGRRGRASEWRTFEYLQLR